MKVTLNWLKQYVDFDWAAEELAERLTMLGIEVEDIQKLGGEFEGIVVAEVITRDRHPNADKLTLCRVNDGKGERQIVCGAHNFQPGDKVPLILPGASLPAGPGQPPMLIKVGKIRGVESQGMMCSPQELGLPDQVDGLLILRPDAKVGQTFAEYLGRAGSDVVYDLEITPNRPDLNSVIGIAREISALTGNPMRLPEIQLAVSSDSQPISELVRIRVEDPELCPRYTARAIRGVKIARGPDWLRSTLEKVGVRSINNVVDVTNYVMLETGQPLHAFDYQLLASDAGRPQSGAKTDGDRPGACPTIVVRRAVEGQKFMTLDGQERTLNDQILLIADETKPIALAGVMGGLNTEINLNTTDVLLESAYFKPQNIRATSKKLELRTESSYRFERGGDIGICDWASQRAAQLILETAGGSMASGVVDACSKPIEPRQITVRPHKVCELLGIELRPEQIETHLAQLGLKLTNRKPQPVGADVSTSEPLTFRIPSFRVDLKREVDLIEEVVRLYGVDKIPSTAPRGAIGFNAYDAIHDELAEARRLLTGLGLFETQGQTLISRTAARLACGEPAIPLANPLSSDMDVLRPSLLPGLLDVLRHNISRKNYDVGFFELGRVFGSPAGAASSLAAPGGSKPGAADSSTGVREERHIAIALTGQRNAAFWIGLEREAKFDLFDLKGLLEEFLGQFGLRGLTYTHRSECTTLFLESAIIQLGKFQVGEFGQLLPAVAKQYDLRDAVLLAEVDLDLLLSRRNTSKAFKPLPAQPSVRRDVALVVSESIAHEAVLQAIKQAKPQNLESVDLFDVFRGKHIPAGQKSMAYAFTYRHAERSLIDAEVNAAHQKVVEHLKQRLPAIVRE